MTHPIPEALSGGLIERLLDVHHGTKDCPVGCSEWLGRANDIAKEAASALSQAAARIQVLEGELDEARSLLDRDRTAADIIYKASELVRSPEFQNQLQVAQAENGRMREALTTVATWADEMDADAASKGVKAYKAERAAPRDIAAIARSALTGETGT